MSNRLLKSQIERAISAILDHRFKAEENALRIQQEALGLRIYERTFSAADIKLMNSLKKGWLPCTDNVRFQIGENSSGVDSLPLPKGMRVPNNKMWTSNNTCVLVVLTSNDPLANDILDSKQLEEDFNSRWRIAKRELGVLYHFSSLSKLRQAWPEVVPFLEANISELSLPSVQVDFKELSRKLGLLTTEESAP